MTFQIQDKEYTSQEVLAQFVRINELDDEFPICPLANDPKNMNKNRYGNILPYENTAVKLSAIGLDDSTTYINANFVNYASEDLFSPSQRFICTQAPVEESIDDFWRMVWEYNVELVIMLTGIKEKGQIKATRYWPSRVPLYEGRGEYSVKFVEENKEPDITVRHLEMWQNLASSSDDSFEYYSEGEIEDSSGETIFTLSMVQDLESLSENTEVRPVVQIHSHKWEDFGVPDTCSYMIKLIELYEAKKPQSCLDNVLVHCSAGVGRTGTFIAIIEALHQYRSGKEVNIESIVTEIRKQRRGMVQTPEQYQFIYKVVEEVINQS